MANGFSTFLSNAIVTAVLVTPTFPNAATLYIALFSSDPTDDNVTANEASGAWYARRPTSAFAAASAGVTSNSNQIQWSAVTGSAITVTHWGVYDASTSGNLLFSGALTASKTFNVGDVAVIGANQLVITVD